MNNEKKIIRLDTKINLCDNTISNKDMETEISNIINNDRKKSIAIIKGLYNTTVLPTSFQNINYYNKKDQGNPIMFVAKDHPLWNNENSLVNRLERFIDEKYILIDTEVNSQKILLILSIIIGILLILDYYIEQYKKRNNIINDSNFMKIIKDISTTLKLFSALTLGYYNINNILLRTTSLTYKE